MIGKTFNRLTITAYSHKDRYYARYWHCSCSCGGACVVNHQKLISGHTKSCGCIKKEKRARYIDGRSKDPLYKVYYEMLNRCHNPDSSNYHKYGALGISVCDSWRHSFESFRDWASNNGYEAGLSIDRENVYGGYSPDNCRWVTQSTQMLNRRVWSKTPYISFNSTKRKWVGRITNNGIRVEVACSVDQEFVLREVLDYVAKNNLIEQQKVLRNAGFTF